MIQIYGSLFALVQIVETCQWVADANGIDGSIAVDVGRRDQLRTTILGSAQEYCLKFELKSALDRINRIKLLFDYPHDCTHANMRQQLKTLHENIEDDLRNRIHWQIPVSKIVHIDDVEDIPFTEGPDLIQARREWYEAEWCFGLERYTACVAHAMRLAELGLRSLTRQLIGDAILGRAIEFVDWKPMLDAVEPVIKQKLDALKNDPRTAERERKVRFYSEAMSQLEYFKNVRDEIAHARSLKDEGEALSALNKVKDFVTLMTEVLP